MVTMRCNLLFSPTPPTRRRPLRLAAWLVAAALAPLAAAWATAAGPPPTGETQRLIGQLSSESFREREAAARALAGLGEDALPALRRAEAGPDAEVRRAAKRTRETIEARLRADAPAVFRKLGGKVRPTRPDSEIPWLWVDLRGTKVADTDLRYLKWLGPVRTVWLDGTDVTDAGLAHLRALDHMYELGLCKTRVTGAGLVHLEGLRELQSLVANDSGMSDAGLAHVGKLPGLRWLQLERTRVTDAGLGHLKELKQLEHLYLTGTKISDAGLAHLKGLPALHGVEAVGTDVTDAGAADFHKTRHIVVPHTWDENRRLMREARQGR